MAVKFYVFSAFVFNFATAIINLKSEFVIELLLVAQVVKMNEYSVCLLYIDRTFDSY
jgi:hypothetical protein